MFDKIDKISILYHVPRSKQSPDMTIPSEIIRTISCKAEYPETSIEKLYVY